MKFPTQVFKSPGKLKVFGRSYNIKGVDNQEQLDKALSDGWILNRDEALFPEKYEKRVEDEIDEISPPTRSELEQKAKELGLKFDGRTSDKKLAKMIEDSNGLD